jgi:peptidoglycan/xylan/chitin deacetylase (PgdA/CDA1 family)
MAPSVLARGREDARPPRVALTFDDGPSPATPAVLDALAEAGARATFFVLGGQVEQQAAVLRRVVAEGHEVGNHSWSHPDLDVRKDVDLAAEIARTGEAVARAAGLTPRVFRPPYGRDPERWARAAGAAGLTTVLWSVETWDWEDDADSETIARRALEGLHPGAIVLLHDGARHDAHPTVAALPQILDGVRAAGYTTVTVSELS